MRVGHTAESPRRAAAVLLAATLLVAVSACNAKAVSEEVGEFARSVNAANTAIASYYGGLNDREMDLYFQMLELDPSMTVGDYITFSADGQKYTVESPLKQPPFDLNAIRERINVLSHLTAYSRGLAELAGAESPSNFQANISTLRGKLEDLQQRFAGRADPRAKQYAGALQNVAGILGKWYLEAKRWNAVKAAVVEAEKPVDALLGFVAEDLERVQTVTETGVEQKYTAAIVYYNLHREKTSDARRVAALEEIRRYKEAWDAARTSRPNAVVERLKKAHAALVSLARADDAASMAVLRTQLALYKDDVQALVEAARIIAGARQE